MAIFTVITSGGFFGQNLFDTEIGSQGDNAGLKDIDGDGTTDLRFVAIIGNFAALDKVSGYGVIDLGSTTWRRMTNETIQPDAAASNAFYWGSGSVGFVEGGVANSDDNWTKVNFSSGDGWVQWRLGNGTDTIIPLRFVREAEGIDLSAAQAYRAAFGINSAPLAVNFLNTTTAFNENTSTADRTKVADISVTDDELGTNLLSLNGTDASVFEIDGTTLYLKAGTTLDFESKQSYSVTVNAADNTAVGSSPNASKTFTLQVNDLPENVAPVANPDTKSTNENTPVTISVLANDTDTDGDLLSITTVNGNPAAVGTPIPLASGALLTLNSNGTFSYNPNGQFESLNAGATDTDSFAYTVSDGKGGTDTATATITITGVNDAATITGTSSKAVTEDAATPNLTATGSLTVSDVDAGEAKFNTAVTTANGNLGSLSISDAGAWSYSVANSAVQFLGAGKTTTETFTVKSLDRTATQDITITLNGVNDAPVAVTDSFLATQGTPLTISVATLLGNDSDIDTGDVLSITGVSSAVGGSVALNNGTITFNPSGSGAGGFNYILSDSTTTTKGTVNVLIGSRQLGGNGKDLLTGNDGPDYLDGGNGNDIINGGAGGDTLRGDNGNDTLIGGTGSDIVTGGNGNDVFVLAAGAGTDTITDFKIGTDVIGLSGGLSFAQLARSGNTISIGNEVLANLTGINAATLTQSSFITI